MSQAGPSSIPQASLLELRALTAEHTDRFAKEGKTSVKGQARRNATIDKVKDPFKWPSPGLVKRLAAEARNESKQRHFQDEDGPNEEQRRAILQAKARKYAAMRRGDFSDLSAKVLEENVIDFERKWEEDGFSEHSSDEDESARSPRRLMLNNEADDLEQVEFVDEMGRTRVGTRREAREAEDARPATIRSVEPLLEDSSYAEVLQSTVIHGDQNFFPVYEPDPEAIKAKYRAAEEEARAHHYDSTKEVRARGAGQYQFSLDEEERAKQMASLTTQRAETEQARKHAESRGQLSSAQEAKKRKLEERKGLIEAKRAKLLGGQAEVDRLKVGKRAAEAAEFLTGIEQEMYK